MSGNRFTARWRSLQVVGLGLVLLATQIAQADVYTWDGGGVGNNWTTGANWNPDGAPSPGSDLEIVLATTASKYTAVVDTYSPWTLNKLTIGSHSYTVSGNQLAFTGADARLITIGSSHGFTFNNPVALNSTLTYEMRQSYNFTFSGAVSGSGGLTIINGPGAVSTTLGHIGAASTYTGPTDIYARFSISETAGSILNSSAINLWGGGTLSFASGGPSSRLSDAVPIYLRGGELFNGKADETVGVVTLDGTGISTITANTATILRLTQLERASNAVAFVRGNSLGQVAGSRILVNNPDSAGKTMTDYLVGGGGGAGSTTVSIVPWLVGGTTATAEANTFVTYDVTLGFRPLDTNTEFKTTLASAGAQDNVRLTASEALTGNKTINSLFITHQTGGINVSGAHKLTVASGAIAFKENNVTPQITVSTLDFNGREAVITEMHEGAGANSAASISSIITNAAGLTFSGINFGSWPGNLALTGASVYTGRTTVAGGTINLGGGDNRLPTSTVVRVNRLGALNLGGQNQAVRGLEGAGTVINVTTGLRTLTLQPGTSELHQFSGSLTGSFLRVVKDGLGTQVLHGNQTYAGTTAISNGTLVVHGKLTSGGGAVTVHNGGRLGGTGFVDRAVSVQTGGSLAPGASPGTLFVADLTLVGIYEFEGYDLTVVTNQLTLSSGWELRLLQNGRLGDGPGKSVPLFTYTTAGSLALTPGGDMTINTAFLGFTPSSTLSLTAVGGTVYLNGIQFVPEPSTILLLGMGTWLLWRWQRRGGQAESQMPNVG